MKAVLAVTDGPLVRAPSSPPSRLGVGGGAFRRFGARDTSGPVQLVRTGPLAVSTDQDGFRITKTRGMVTRAVVQEYGPGGAAARGRVSAGDR